MDDYLAQFDARSAEELDPELAPYLEEGGTFPALKHPLVFSVPYHPALAWMHNDQYRAKLEAVADSLRDGSWGSYVFLHERPYRVDAFRTISDRLTGSEYWELLRDVWVDSENLFQWEDIDLLMAEHPEERHRFMDDDERAALEEMPDPLVVYRGYKAMETGDNSHGWSWTLDREKAEWFAKRLLVDGQTARVLAGKVAKSDVIGYLVSRGEQEVVVDPGNVRTTEDTRVS